MKFKSFASILSAGILGAAPFTIAQDKVVRDGDVLREQQDRANDDRPLPGRLLNKLTDKEKEEGWELLFDGQKLTGFRGLQKSNFLQAGWKIENGKIYLPKDIKQSGRATGGDLVATKAYDNFEFSFEWKLLVSGDTGVVYFGRGGMGQKVTGHEFQIVDDVRNPDSLKGGPIKRTGALYGVLAPMTPPVIRDGSWNEGRIVVEGNRVEHWINGSKILVYTLGSPEFVQAVRSAQEKPTFGFGTKTKSPIVLLDQGEEVHFRNLKIREIKPKPVTPPPAKLAPAPPANVPAAPPPATANTPPRPTAPPPATANTPPRPTAPPPAAAPAPVPPTTTQPGVPPKGKPLPTVPPAVFPGKTAGSPLK